MPIPDYQTLMRPLLDVLADGAEHPLRDIKEKLAAHFELTPDEREQMLASGVSTVFTDRVGWARYYLQRAGMLQQPRRSVYQLTDNGRALLREVNGRITNAHLRERSPDFQQWVDGGRATNAEQRREPESAVEQQSTPEETLANAYLKNRVRPLNPTFSPASTLVLLASSSK